MSSTAFINFDPATGVNSEQWQEFCSEHALVYRPNTIGRNVFYAGQVEVSFGASNYDELPDGPDGRRDFSAARAPEYAEQVTFATYWRGEAMPEVARLATAFWLRFGGNLQADPDIRAMMLRDLGCPVGA